MFKVTDQGMGMNDLDRKNLFKAYFKSSSKQSRQANTNSHGIGLHTSKRLAKVLDGDLLLSDSYRDGCQFIFFMNMTRIEKTDIPKANYRVRGSKFGKKQKGAKTNFKADVNTIYELDEEYLNSRQWNKLEEKKTDGNPEDDEPVSPI